MGHYFSRTAVTPGKIHALLTNQHASRHCQFGILSFVDLPQYNTLARPCIPFVSATCGAIASAILPGPEFSKACRWWSSLAGMDDLLIL